MSDVFEAAKAAFQAGLRPLPIRGDGEKPFKMPLHPDWHKRDYDEAALAESLPDGVERGIGLRLGDIGDGTGVIDLDVDDPVAAAPHLARMFKGADPRTLTVSFDSSRGFHCLFQYDPRLAWVDRIKIAGGTKYTGLEVRIGTTNPEAPRAAQSVIPPTPRSDGQPRVFELGGTKLEAAEVLADWRTHFKPLPDHVLRDLEVNGPNRPGDRWNAEQVKAKIVGDGLVAKLATEWGVRFTGTHREGGWSECKAIDREDKSPSCGVNPTTGVYNDFGEIKSLSIFDLAVATGAYGSFPDAVNGLGQRLMVPPIRKHDSPRNEGSRGHQELAAPEPWHEPSEIVEEPVPAFPVGVFPPKLRRFAVEASESLECPVDYLAVAMIATAAAAIGSTINVQVHSLWTVPLHLYIGIVGPPGTKKTPAIQAATQPLYRIESALRAKWRGSISTTPEGTEPDRNRSERTPPPRQSQIVVSDTTREALADFFAENPRGGLMTKDELSGWVAGLNAHKGGKGDDAQFYMSLNSGQTIRVNRRTRAESVVIDWPSLTILGGIQPGVLEQLKKGNTDDGWLDRILFAFPEPLRSFEIGQPMADTDLEAEWDRAIQRLHNVPFHGRPSIVELTDSARHRFDEWRIRGRRKYDNDSGFAGPWSKMEGFAVRLAGILHHLDLAAGKIAEVEPSPIPLGRMEDALTLADYFMTHFIRARREMSNNLIDKAERTRNLLAKLKAAIEDARQPAGRRTNLVKEVSRQVEPHRLVTKRILQQTLGWSDEEIRPIISHLIDLGYLQVVETRYQGSGRPPGETYAINPLWMPEPAPDRSNAA